MLRDVSFIKIEKVRARERRAGSLPRRPRSRRCCRWRASPRGSRAPPPGVGSALGARDLQHGQLGFPVAHEHTQSRGRRHHRGAATPAPPPARPLAPRRGRGRAPQPRALAAPRSVSGRCGHGRHGARPGEEEERDRRRRPAAAAVAAPVRVEFERERERKRPRGEGERKAVEIERERERPTGEGERKLGEEPGTRSGSPSIYLPGRILMRSQGSRDEAAEKPDKAGEAASDGIRFFFLDR